MVRKIEKPLAEGEGQAILLEDDNSPHCPFCQGSMANSSIMDVDLVQNKISKERILKFTRRCLNCNHKVFVYREQILVWEDTNYLHVNENEWEKVKEEKKVFKDE